MTTIARHWRGVARAERADDYVKHLRGDTFPKLQALPGFLEATILQRKVAQGVEFVIVTVWAGLDAIQGFAGADAEAAVVPAAVKDMMVECDDRARHYEMLF